MISRAVSRTFKRRWLSSASSIACIAILGAASSPTATYAAGDWTQEAACQTLSMASTGGAMPTDRDVAVMRYMGSSNYELAYRNSVILFDAQYARTPPARPLPVTKEQLKKVNAIYIGHGHGDHMVDAPFIAQQANAPMYGAWPSTEIAGKMGLPAKLDITVKNGDVQKYPGFTVQAVLAHHSVRSEEFTSGVNKAWAAMREATGLMPSPEARAKARAEAVQDKKASDAIPAEGTIAWLVTFDDGYKIMELDSSGPITDQERAVMQRIGHVDLAIVAYQGFFVAARQIEATLPLVELFKPSIFMPTHHDETAGSYPDMAIYPLAMAIREKMPATRTISPLYGTPICLNTRTKEAFVGETWTWPSNKHSS